METYAPTTNIIDTAKNVLGYIQRNLRLCWTVTKYYLPYIVLALFIGDLVLPVAFFSHYEPDKVPDFGSLLTYYFFICIAITWHRIIINGPQSIDFVQPFHPRKSELVFAGMAFLIPLVAMVGSIGIGAVFVTLSNFLIPAALAVLVFGAYLALRLSFYFPAKAVNPSATIKQGFALSKGYVWKLIGTSFLTYLPVILISLVYLLVGGSLMIGLTLAFHATGTLSESTIIHASAFLVFLPYQVLLSPVFIMIAVSVLSNFFLIAKRNAQPALYPESL